MAVVNITSLQVDLPLTVKYAFNQGQEISVEVASRQPLQNVIKGLNLVQYSGNDYVRILADINKVSKDKYTRKDIILSGLEVYPLEYKMKLIYTVSGSKYYGVVKSMSGTVLGPVEHMVDPTQVG